LKRFGGGGRNDAPGGSWEYLSNQLDRLAHHIGKACSKARVFKRPNRSFERREVFWCHAINASKCWRSAIPPTSTTGAPDVLRTAMATAFFCPPFQAILKKLGKDVQIRFA
jgi:hypothetical protein